MIKKLLVIVLMITYFPTSTKATYLSKETCFAANDTISPVIESTLILRTDNSPYYINSNVEVKKTADFIIEKGVKIIFLGFYKILVRGTIYVNGTEDAPVEFLAGNNVPFWAQIYCHYSPKRNILRHININKGSLYFQKSKATIEYLDLNYTETDTKDHPIIYVNHSEVKMFNSNIHSNIVREGFTTIYSDSCVVSNCRFFDCPDAIEFTKSKNCIAEHNSIYNPSDDGIDLNACENIILRGNYILGAKDKGISAGAWKKVLLKNITIERNTMDSCGIGFEVKSSEVKLSNNNFINNGIGVHCYRKDANEEIGGTAFIENSIFFNNKEDVVVDSISKASVSYSVSNRDSLKGIANFTANPLFLDTKHRNYRLTKESPCIDAGNPVSKKDLDETIADIGARYFHQPKDSVVINEINYESNKDHYTDDWLELYNPSSNRVSLSDYILKIGTFETLLNNLNIEPWSYLVLAKDKKIFSATFPDAKDVIHYPNLNLPSTSTLIELIDTKKRIIDSVEYKAKYPWPIKANGMGATLELKEWHLDNALVKNWQASESHGSPSKANSSVSVYKEQNRITMRIFPNPVKNYIHIALDDPLEGSINFELYDILGTRIWIEKKSNKPATQYTFDLSDIESGVYFLFISRGYNFRSELIIKE